MFGVCSSVNADPYDGILSKRSSDMSTDFTVKLRRTGLAPLIFKGKQLASVSGQYLQNRENNRWWELSVYRSETEHYVLQVSFYTN